MKEVLKLKDVSKEYGVKGFKSKVLNNISLSVNEGDIISIMGPSGAGKTTLLNLISTLDKPRLTSLSLQFPVFLRFWTSCLSNFR